MKMKKIKGRSLHSPMIKFEYDNKIIQKSTDFRVYSDAILLTPGEYTDSMSASPIVYTEENISETADKWESNYLNLDHSYEVLSRVGYVKNCYFKKGSVRGDLYIAPITTAAKDAIALIDAGLINWLSVEITTQDIWNAEDNKRYATDITYIGAAVVTTPACPSSRIIESGPGPGYE